MSWSSGKPLDKWQDRELFIFFREIYTRLKFDNFTWNPPNVPANSTVDTTLATSDDARLKGLRVGMAVTVSPPATLDAGIIYGGAWVFADDTLTIRLANVTGAGINPVTGVWSYFGMVN